MNFTRFVNLLNQSLDTNAATEHVLKESKSCISQGLKFLLLQRNVVPNIKPNAIAVAGTRCQIKADPLGCVKEVVLNLLADGVVQGGIIERTPRDDGLIHIVY